MATDLGTGLQLVDGDIVFAKGRLVELTGVPNLAQALTVRVLTPLGTDPCNTTYGFDARNVFTQPASAGEVQDLIKLNLVRTLATDARVQEVRDVVFDAAPNTQRRAWTADVSIVTADNQPATLRLTVEI